jgi:hypothetical protein
MVACASQEAMACSIASRHSRRVIQFGTQRNLADARRLLFRTNWSDRCTRKIARLQRWVQNVRQMSMRPNLLLEQSSSIQMS